MTLAANRPTPSSAWTLCWNRGRNAARRCVTFANILFRKGILTPTELALKMQQIEVERHHD
jgi:hypothetical protein